MPQRLNQRKYSELINFLKSVISNNKASIRHRMAAAERLDGLYAREDHRIEQSLRREDRAAQRAARAQHQVAKTPAQPAVTPAEGPTPDDAMLERSKREIAKLLQKS